MALTESQLRQVFDVCDEDSDGAVSITHLTQLAARFLGSAENDLATEVAKINSDVITFPQFCRLFSTIAREGKCEDLDETDDSLESLFGASPRTSSPVAFERLSPSYFTSGPHALLLINREAQRTMPSDDRDSPSSMTELDSALGGSSCSPDSIRKGNSGCPSMSDGRDEVNLECFGEGDDLECDSDYVRISYEADGTSSLGQPMSLPPNNFNRRNSWVRRSLRCSPSSAPKQRVVGCGGTAAVASQLYRTSSFSSGRSSAPDQDQDMYSDASLEDDVIDLNHKVQMLQQQVGVLAENQVNSEDRYTRLKADNAALQARVIMLEEQLRETEMRYEDRLAEEQRRSRELIARVEREKTLTVENYSIRQTNLEKERNTLEEETLRMRAQVERLERERTLLVDRASEAELASSVLNQENSKLADNSRKNKEEVKLQKERSSKVIEELRCEVERLRAAEAQRRRSSNIDGLQPHLMEVQATVKQLRDENKALEEQLEDLQAQLLTSQLEEGRTLISATSNSLAAEFEAMTSEEVAPRCCESSEKLKKSLKDSQEANQHLRSYIDGILLNIVENYPQLLEVKTK